MVTGANRGIGRAIAERFVAAGERVATVYRGGDLPDGVYGAVADMRDTAAIDAAFSQIEAELGPVQVLVANAGVTKDTLLMRMSDDDFTDVIDVNLTGTFRCVRRVTKGMIRARYGRIVLISSVVGLYGSPGQVNYAASKSALVGIARSVTRELGGRGITCNVISPGFIDTAMTAALPEATQGTYLASIPARPVRAARRGRRGGRVRGVRRRRLHQRRRHPCRRWPRHGPLTPITRWKEARVGLLEGKRILVTGVLVESSFAFHVAKLAQLEGAEVVLTSFGKAYRLTQVISRRLPREAPVVHLDVNSTEDLDGLAAAVSEHLDGLDGVVHSIGFAPQSVMGGNFLAGEWEDVAVALQTSAYSLKALAVAAKPLMSAGARSSG